MLRPLRGLAWGSYATVLAMLYNHVLDRVELRRAIGESRRVN